MGIQHGEFGQNLKRRTVLATVWANSSKFNFPSPSWSASMMVLSTICCSCWSCDQADERNRGRPGLVHTFKLLPTIIFNTKKSSPLEMNPSRSTSYTLKATIMWRFWAHKSKEGISFSVVKREIATNISASLPDHRDCWMRSALQRILENRLCLRHWNSHESWTFLDCTPPNGTHSSSKIAIIREAKGFVAIWGICRNSSRSIDPEPSLLLVRLIVTNWARTQYSPVQFHKSLFQPFKLWLCDFETPALATNFILKAYLHRQLERFSISSINCDSVG